MFAKIMAQPDASCNRSPLLEVCQQHRLAIGNICFSTTHYISKLITSYNVGATPDNDVILTFFLVGKIDFMMISRNGLNLVEDVCANRIIS